MHVRTFALTLLLLLSPIPARAEDVVLGGRTLHLPVSDGYCALDAANEIDSLLIKVMVDMQRGSNELAAYWVDCEQYARIQKGESDYFSTFILILAQFSGHERVVPLDMALSEYLAVMRREIVKANGGKDLLPSDYKARLRERLDEVIADIGADGSGISMGETRMLGLLAEDAVGLYLGLVQHAVVDGRSDVSGGVFGVTELNGLSITINVYDEYRNAETFEVLVDRARKIVSDLVARNPTAP